MFKKRHWRQQGVCERKTFLCLSFTSHRHHHHHVVVDILRHTATQCSHNPSACVCFMCFIFILIVQHLHTCRRSQICWPCVCVCVCVCVRACVCLCNGFFLPWHLLFPHCRPSLSLCLSWRHRAALQTSLQLQHYAAVKALTTLCSQRRIWWNAPKGMEARKVKVFLYAPCAFL